MANKRIKDISTTATSPASDDFVVLDSSSQGTRKIDAGPLGGVFDEDITTTGGNVTITGDTSDAYTAGTLKLTAGNLGTNSIQLGDVSDADIGMIQYANSDNSMRFTTNGSERLRVDATGNVSIGGTGAARKLHVTSSGTVAQFESTSTAAYVSLKESGGNHTYLGNAAGDFVIQTADGGYSSKLVVYNGGNVAVPQGKLGIGGSPSAGLHLEQASTDNVLAVVGQDGYNGTLFLAAEGSGKDAYINVGGNRNLQIDFATSSTPAATGTNKFTFSKLGRLGIGGSPDYTLDVKRTDAAGDYAYLGASSDGGQRGLKFTSADNGIYLGAAHTIDATSSGGSLAFSVNGTTRWSINSSGTLYAAASETPIEWNGNGLIRASSHIYFSSTSGGNLYFQTGGAQRWEINSNGNLIGNSGGQILYGDGDVLFPGASANLSWDKSADTLTLQAGAKAGIGAAPGSTALRVSGGSGQLFKVDDGANALVTVDATGNVDVASGVTTLTNTGDNALRVESTDGNPMTVNVVGSAPNYLFDVRDDGTSKFRVDGSGRLGVGSTAMGSYNSNANNLVVGSGSGNEGITIATDATGEGGVYFADGTTGNEQYRGYAVYQHTQDRMIWGTAGTNRWYIDSSGDLKAWSSGTINVGSGGGIDFGAATTSAGGGSGTTGTVSNSLLSDYEFGSWVPAFATSGTNFATMTMDVRAAQYVKVGRHVHCQAYIRTDNVDATGASGTVVVEGLPFIPEATTANYSTLNVGYSALWVNAPAAGYVQPNAAYVSLTRYSTTTSSLITPSDLTAGSSADKNELIFSISYIAST